MANQEQVRAPNYPEYESHIKISHTEGAYMEANFDIAISSHGNDDQFSWKSYAIDDDETFTLRRYGASATSPEVELADGFLMSKWLLEFQTREKILLFDAGTGKVERYEGELLVDASPKDISDLVAAHINLQYYSMDRRSQGWSLEDDAFIDELRDMFDGKG